MLTPPPPVWVQQLQTNHLLSVPGKVFAHVLLARLDPLLQKHRRPHQSGFTRCRSSLDAILALRLLTEIHRKFQQPLHVAFVDLKAAFDSVDRNALWKAMRGIGVPPILMDHIATSARVRLAVRLSTPFITLTSGVRQGCVLAPALFCQAMDFIMEHVSRKVGIQVGQHTFTDIDYADDVVLVDKEESFRAALVSMDEEASKFALRVSWTKTKIQNLGSGWMVTLSTQLKSSHTWAVYSPVRATPDRNISSALDSRPGAILGHYKRQNRPTLLPPPPSAEHSGLDCLFTWKKWTLKFKLFYLLNRSCYFNKICRIFGMNHLL